MKYLTFTFDDGRIDNYQYAFPILNTKGFPATLFCTTGYIDGSWQKELNWLSAGKAISIEELKQLSNAGWEIALHGDRHVMSVEDMRIAYNKLSSWGFDCARIGCSIPNSRVSESDIDLILNSDYGDAISYIRRGRKCSTKNVFSRLLYVLYSYLNISWAYRTFNRTNNTYLECVERYNIPSVVIRLSDKPRMILDYLDSLPDDTLVVFMFHSILPETHSLYGKDPWCWSMNNFDYLCSQVRLMCDKGNAIVTTMMDAVSVTN